MFQATLATSHIRITCMYTVLSSQCGTLLALFRALHKLVSHKTENYAENIPEDGATCSSETLAPS
jgi:hypothetical protein